MGIEQIMNVVAPAGIFGALFIWLFFKYMAESKERETKLTAVITEQGKTLADISTTLTKIDDRLCEVEEHLTSSEA